MREYLGLSQLLYALPLVYIVTLIVYRIYFHELAKYPGPFLGKFTSLPKMVAMVRMDRVTWQTEMLTKYGSPVRVGTRELIFGDMKSWQDIYGQSSNPCTKEPNFYNMFTASGATSILSEIDRTRHSRLRRLVSHGFSQAALLQDEAILKQKVEVFLDVIFDPAAKQGVSVDIYDKMMEHYLDIVSYLSFGNSFNSVSGKGEMDHHDLDRFMTVVPIQSFFPLLRYVPLNYIQEGYRGLNRLIKFSQSSVQGLIDKIKQDPTFAAGTFLRNLVDAEDTETGSRLSMEELVENTIIFLVAGSDTTAITTLYTIWECGRNPTVTGKLVGEIRTAFPDPKEIPTYEKASKLPYLNATIQETLRKWGPLSAAFPRVSPGREISGHYISKGTVVSTSAYATSRDPRVFPEPEVYNPDRWLNAGKEMKEMSRPFSYGPRNCIGKHLAQIGLTLTLSRMYQLYDIENDPSAGIHIPPNSCRVLTRFGLLDKLKQAGGYQVEGFTLRRYQNGQVLVEKPLKGRMDKEYGAEWIAIHRGDYQNVLLAEALEVGASVVTDAEVTGVETARDRQQILLLKSGQRIEADVVIGADGLWSLMREIVLERPFPPIETGDLAYRGTFSRAQLLALNNERINKILKQSNIQVWLGPGRHAVFYPLRDHTEYNLVLIVADNLPKGVRTSRGSLEEMASNFKGWDPILSEIISCLESPLKWKLLHFESLDKWTKGTIALLGDASHPTLPYQGQGAAMAVEDGAILGLLLAKLQGSTLPNSEAGKNAQISALFHFYQDLRQKRTDINVAGAVHTRHYYHLADGDEQEQRDKELAGLPNTNWQGACLFNWGDTEYQRSLLGFDVLADTEKRFGEWLQAFYEAERTNAVS
ncbi:Fc.00g000230.m01.CDS01 [Cosmosporella sp. VM-42]